MSPRLGAEIGLPNSDAVSIVCPSGLDAAAEELGAYLESVFDQTYVLGEIPDANPDATVFHLEIVEGEEFPVGKGVFVLDFENPSALRIQGNCEEDVQNGVYEFLERHLGIRWLFPGPMGEVVPKLDQLNLPKTRIVYQPAFTSRDIPFGSQEGERWAKRLKSADRLEFHHNLFRVLTDDILIESMAPWNGSFRRMDVVGKRSGWQPCFQSVELEEAVAQLATNHFRGSRWNSFSLGINDPDYTGAGFCRCQPCRSLDVSLPNFLGKANLSQNYYEFCNRVAKNVRDSEQSRFTLGCLAYAQVAEAPSFDLDEAIVPFLTFDRQRWVDKDVESLGRRISEDWVRRSPGGVGFYEYYFGDSIYAFPRIGLHQMARNYRFAHEIGVRACWAQAGDSWSNGPSLYVAFKLQWDPYLDVDQLLEEWCRNCVGAGASDDLVS